MAINALKKKQPYTCFGHCVSPSSRAENRCEGCEFEKECMIESSGKPKETMFQLALKILHDECPPDNCMYYCSMGEEPECDCETCWENYLFWAANGYQKEDDPYRFDRKRGE